MRPIRPGDRGSAVEDVQRRLLTLGYDLGKTGVDGVFLGVTAEAVSSFQKAHGLSEDGTVGDETWSTLVDATFTFGDRMLYLRVPHFHGRDVKVLQQALNSLGFACGDVDGIFGAYTERAVRDFQHNAALPADGIVGPETASAIAGLRHVWEGREAGAHSAAHIAPARACEVLARVEIAVSGCDAVGQEVAERIANLALATTDAARVRVLDGSDEAPESAAATMRIFARGTELASGGRPLVRFGVGENVRSRLVMALGASPQTGHEMLVELEPDALEGEIDRQRVAVELLDALCAAFD